MTFMGGRISSNVPSYYCVFPSPEITILGGLAKLQLIKELDAIRVSESNISMIYSEILISSAF